MFSSGNVTIYVAHMSRAVRFYTEVLGLKLKYAATKIPTAIPCTSPSSIGATSRAAKAAIRVENENHPSRN